MKHEFDTPALRQTAEEIQGAVRAKSITADMVGGTLLALVNATGEIIETFGGIGNSITVKAKCKALINITEWEEEVAQGATVYVDMFAIGIGSTRNFPTQVLTADENGEVVFTVPCGYGYAVYSKYDGYSASCQFAFVAGDADASIELWNYPIGIYILGDGSLYETAEAWDGDPFNGIVVCSENTSFCILHHKSEEYMPWGRSGEVVPCLPLINDTTHGSYADAQGAVRLDFNGNLNTLKILSGYRAAPAASWCDTYSQNPYYTHWQYFLPSAGQLYLIYQNKAAINALLADANAIGSDYTNGFEAIGNDYLWSSTQYDEWCAWVVGVSNGNAFNGSKDNYYYVRAVSAFQMY